MGGVVLGHGQRLLHALVDSRVLARELTVVLHLVDERIHDGP